MPVPEGFSFSLSHTSPPSLRLSLVIPAFNESARLGHYLSRVRDFLEAGYGRAYEVLVVDDGSSDTTASLVENQLRDWPQLQLIRHAINQGKGAAVRTGVLAARSPRILFTDADGATPIEEERRLAAAIGDGADVAVGSRCITGPGVFHQRTRGRAASGSIFRWLAHHVVPVRVQDTQCGFKMFEAVAGQALFEAMTENGYLFDMEMLVLAERAGLRVDEVAVNWADQAGSKVRVLRDGLRMIRDLWRLRRRTGRMPQIAFTRTATRQAA